MSEQLSRDVAAALLARYGADAPWTRHCYAVASAAERVGAMLPGSTGVDLDTLWSFGLLHDIGRCATHHPIGHGVEGYRLLSSLGYHEAAFVCVAHVGFGLSAAEASLLGLPEREFVPQTYEERIVCLADLLVEGDRPTTLEARIASLHRRYADDAEFLPLVDRAHERALAFMMRLLEETGTSAEEAVAR